MLGSRSFVLTAFLVCGILTSLHGQSPAAGETANRIQLQFNTSEADAVLAILEKRATGSSVADADWQRLFATEPYVRLKKREASMHRDFTDDDFKKFVLSPELATKESSLRHTLDAWKKADLNASARRVLTYLPEQAVIKAKVFAVIKPKTNSFVFETQSDPAIFLYLDPEESAVKFENTVAHELHHIGYSSIAPLADARQKDVPANAKAAVEWMEAFGEGFAMLAAAGGPDIDPHASSSPKEHARWDHDLANFNDRFLCSSSFWISSTETRRQRQDQREGILVFRRRAGRMVHRRIQDGRDCRETIRPERTH